MNELNFCYEDFYNTSSHDAESINQAVKVLNAMTEEQRKAVKLLVKNIDDDWGSRMSG